MISLTEYSEIIPWMMEQKILYVKTNYITKSFKIFQARYKIKFNFKTFPNRSQIFKLIKNSEVHGTSEDCRATGSPPSGTDNNPNT